MIKYKSLPKNTPISVVIGILLTGVGLSYSIVVCGLVAIFGLTGLFGEYFYSASNIAISGKEAVALGLLVVLSVITTVMFSFLAFYMNRLSKKTYRLSRIVWLPSSLTVAYFLWLANSHVLATNIETSGVVAVKIIIPLGAILPALFFSQSSTRKVHNR